MFDLINELKKAPFSRLILPFISGIILGIYSPFSINFLMVISACILCILVFPLSWRKNIFHFRHGWIVGTGFFILMLLAGANAVSMSVFRMKNQGEVINSEKMIILVDESFSETKAWFKAPLRVLNYKENSWKRSQARIMTYLKIDSFSKDIHLGDILLVESRPSQIDPPANPDAFDYQKYLYFQGINGQLFVKPNHWKKLGTTSNYKIRIYRIREELLGIFRRAVKDDQDYGVLSALVLGYTGDLTNEIKQAYASTGAMHVLSVSGLHVGIVYIFLSSLLFFMNRRTALKILKAVLLLSGIWFYALLTGMSAPVLRSSIMFSCFAVATVTRRPANPYNTLFISAFGILLMNPFQIKDVGFQLSFIAVLSILLLYKMIYNIFISSSWLLDKLWACISVSLAAQIGTFPLSIFYFNQFPNYFLITNLLVIPLTTLILYTGIILLIVSPVNIISVFVSPCLAFMLKLLNIIIIFIEKLPFSTSAGLYISLPEMMLAYCILICIFIFIRFRESRFRFAALCCLCILIMSHSIREINNLQQNKLVVYKIPGHSAVEIIKGKKNFMIIDDSLSANKNELYKITKNFWIRNGIKPDEILKKVKIKTLKDSNLIIRINDRTIVLLRDERIFNFGCSFPLKTDFLIISGNLKCSGKELLNYFSPEEVILNADGDRRNIRFWQTEIKRRGIKFHPVLLKGAYIANL